MGKRTHYEGLIRFPLFVGVVRPRRLGYDDNMMSIGPTLKSRWPQANLLERTPSQHKFFLNGSFSVRENYISGDWFRPEFVFFCIGLGRRILKSPRLDALPRSPV